MYVNVLTQAFMKIKYIKGHIHTLSHSNPSNHFSPKNPSGDGHPTLRQPMKTLQTMIHHTLVWHHLTIYDPSDIIRRFIVSQPLYIWDRKSPPHPFQNNSRGLMALRIARKAALRFSNSSAVLILLLLVNIPGAVWSSIFTWVEGGVEVPARTLDRAKPMMESYGFESEGNSE